MTKKAKRMGLPELMQLLPIRYSTASLKHRNEFMNYLTESHQGSTCVQRPTLLKSFKEKLYLFGWYIYIPLSCHNKHRPYEQEYVIYARIMQGNVTSFKKNMCKKNSRALPSTCSGSAGLSTSAPSRTHGRLSSTQNEPISNVNHQSQLYFATKKSSKKGAAWSQDASYAHPI